MEPLLFRWCTRTHVTRKRLAVGQHTELFWTSFPTEKQMTHVLQWLDETAAPRMHRGLWLALAAARDGLLAPGSVVGKNTLMWVSYDQDKTKTSRNWDQIWDRIKTKTSAFYKRRYTISLLWIWGVLFPKSHVDVANSTDHEPQSFSWKGIFNVLSSFRFIHPIISSRFSIWHTLPNLILTENTILGL